MLHQNSQSFSLHAAHQTNVDGVWIRPNQARPVPVGSVFKLGGSTREFKASCSTRWLFTFSHMKINALLIFSKCSLALIYCLRHNFKSLQLDIMYTNLQKSRANTLAATVGTVKKFSTSFQVIMTPKELARLEKKRKQLEDLEEAKRNSGITIENRQWHILSARETIQLFENTSAPMTYRPAYGCVI